MMFWWSDIDSGGHRPLSVSNAELYILTLKALYYFCIGLNYGDQFEIIINILVSSSRFI